MTEKRELKVGNVIRVRETIRVNNRQIDAGQKGQIVQILDGVAMILPWDTGHEVMTLLTNLELDTHGK